MSSYFYLGAHGAHWLWSNELRELEKAEGIDNPMAICVSYGTLRRLKKWYPAIRPAILDSKAFTQITTYGRFVVSAQDYARDCIRVMEEIGNVEAFGIQDFMCEPIALAATGLTLREHQSLTVESYLRLRELAPSVPFMPTLQGFIDEDYFRCIEMYYQAGVELHKVERVGLGSVCRRQHTQEINNLLLALRNYELNLHGYGVKVKALERIKTSNTPGLLPFSDSMAWSIHARNRERLVECTHTGNCNGCFRYALRWRQRLLADTKLILN